MDNKYYNIEEISSNYKNKLYQANQITSKLNKIYSSLYFQLRVFKRFYCDYFKRTPESDSLYRRRNRLIILASSGLFYYKTASGIFDRIELEIFSSLNKRYSPRILFIPLGKTLYFLSCIFVSQLAMKYLYYLNKAFKSTQFASEGVLKYNIIKENYTYYGDYEKTGRFDIVDSENIKKNQ